MTDGFYPKATLDKAAELFRDCLVQHTSMTEDQANERARNIAFGLCDDTLTVVETLEAIDQSLTPRLGLPEMGSIEDAATRMHVAKGLVMAWVAVLVGEMVME